MFTAWLATAFAGSLAAEADARVDALGPHVAYYVKESTGEPKLQIHYAGPAEASAKAMSDAGVFSISADADYMRIQLPDGVCARVGAREIIESTNPLHLGLDADDGAPTPRLIYRAAADSHVELETSFLGVPSPVLFSWHADLDKDGVTVSENKSTWDATSTTSEWSVLRKTGVLQRMAVGDDALVLDRLESGKKAAPQRAADVCEATTAETLALQVSTQIRLQSVAGAYAAVIPQWEGLDDAARADAQKAYRQWWSAFLGDELRLWEQDAASGDWRAKVERDVTDVAAYDAFVAGLPEQQRPRAMDAWKLSWYDRVGHDLLGGHLQELLRVCMQHLEAPPSEAVRVRLLGEPLEQALLEKGEPHVQRLLIPLLEASAAKLQAALDAR